MVTFLMPATLVSSMWNILSTSRNGGRWGRDRFGRRVVDERRAVRVALDVALECPCRLRIDEMARPVGQDAALYPHAEQCQVAQYVEQFVSCYFVDEAELQVVDVSVRDADVLFVENPCEAFEFRIGNLLLGHHYRIVQVAPLDEVGGQQGFEFVQEGEGTAGSYLLRVVLLLGEGGVLVSHHARMVVHMDRYAEFAVGIDDYRRILFGVVEFYRFAYLVILPFGLLFFEAGLRQGGGEIFCRAIHYRCLGGVNLHDGIVDAQRPEGRHDVFDGAHLCSAFLYGRTPRRIGDVIGQGGYFGAPFEVGAAEYDAAACGGGVDGHVRFHARMESFAAECYRSFQRLLVISHKVLSIG